MWLAYQLINRIHGKTNAGALPRDYLLARFAGCKVPGTTRLEKKMAASVNVLPQMDSMYHWKGEIRHGTEHKIFIKTCAKKIDALQREIRAAHPYAVAEILCFKIDSGDPEYLDWITRSTQ
jgi:periplasmic divalent cation tolerance protein